MSVLVVWLGLNASAFVTQWTPSALDKPLHAIAFFVIAFFAARAAFDGAARKARPLLIVAVVTACVSVGALDEWVQGGSASRVSDATDLVADGFGALLGAGAAWLDRARRDRRAG